MDLREGGKLIVAVGGLDPSGGAGIEMDVKVGESIGVKVHPVATCITWQTADAFLGLKCLEPDDVVKQLKVTPMRNVKTGALCSEEIVNAISFLKPLVVDPVVKASAGGELYKGSLEVLKDFILSSFAITPNWFEASIIMGRKIRSVEDAVIAAKEISSMGPRLVIVTGGDQEEFVDIIYYDGEVIKVKGIKSKGAHGSGSVLASALASYLSLGLRPLEASLKALGFARIAVSNAKEGIPDPMFLLRLESSIAKSWIKYNAFLKWLEKIDLEKITPEVGINVAYGEVVIGKGSIIGIKERIRYRPCGCPRLGGSDHMARLLLEIKKCMDINVVMNIRFDEKFVEKLKRKYKVMEVKGDVPKGSMQHFARQACKEKAKVIFDRGRPGKEAMIRLLAKDFEELKDMILTVIY